MTAQHDAPRRSLGAEVAVALAVGLAAFIAVSVTLAAAESDLAAVPLGLLSVAAVLVLMRAGAAVLAIPVAIAVLVGFDWYRFPPTHAEALPDAQNLFTLGAYLLTGVAIGQLAIRATRRADLSEAARIELADEQAALRRVATLVAQGASQADVFAAVARETRDLLGTEESRLWRYEDDKRAVIVTGAGELADLLPTGTRVELVDENATSIVHRTGRSLRIDGYGRATGGPVAEAVSSAGIRAAVAAPVVVDGRLWGCVVTATTRGDVLPPDSELRLAEFTELMGIAIANAHSCDQLMASRARLLTAGNDARRRVVRDLHDGAQQRLVHTVVTLKLAQRALRANACGDAQRLLAEALEQAEAGNDELRELAHGLLPATLARGGLLAGVDALVSRLSVPVRVAIPYDRFPAEIEANAYFIVAEALTNVVKHSRGSRGGRRLGVRRQAADRGP